jgi:hypothetical protein
MAAGRCGNKSGRAGSLVDLAEEGQVQDGPRVAGVHDGVQAHPRLQRVHQRAVDLVVHNLAVPLKVHRAQRLVVPVHLQATPHTPSQPPHSRRRGRGRQRGGAESERCPSTLVVVSI